MPLWLRGKGELVSLVSSVSHSYRGSQVREGYNYTYPKTIYMCLVWNSWDDDMWSFGILHNNLMCGYLHTC